MTSITIKCSYEGCSRTYCSTFNLKRHIQSAHLGIRKFQCLICKKLLSSKQNFIDHQNIHTGAKPYECEISGCNSRFRQFSQYYFHKQMHLQVSHQLEKRFKISENFLKFLVQKIGQESSDEHHVIPSVPCLCMIEIPKITVNKFQSLLPKFESILKY